MQDEIYFQELRQVGPRPVWQITPPVDRPVHTADELASGGPPATPAGGYPLTDHGGSTLKQPRLVLVTLGSWWGDLQKLEQFAGDLMDAGYLAPLSAYGSGQGTYAGSFKVSFAGPISNQTITDAALQETLFMAISQGAVPAPDANTLYALVLPDGVTVDQGGYASCTGFCGYHDAFTVADGRTVYYSVQPSPNCKGCLPPGDTAFDVFTAVLAHEVAEACTDAIPGEGWYNDQTGMENADEWAWQFFPYGPWNVHGYQVNGTGNAKALIQYSPPSQPNPQPGPQPQPQPQWAPAVDTEFAQLATIVQSAATSDPRNAGWYQGGLIWLRWAKQNIDAVLAATAWFSPSPSPSPAREREGAEIATPTPADRHVLPVAPAAEA
jgi:hypothetical protein